MSLPVIAIIVASVSALFTGLNMTFSFLTYRRMRPHVKILPEARWVKDDDSSYNLSLRVAIRNKGQNPVVLANEVVVFVRDRHDTPGLRDYVDPLNWYKVYNDWKPQILLSDQGTKTLAAVGDSGRDLEVQAFNGTVWHEIFHKASLPLQLPSHRKHSFRVMLTLSSGKRVLCRWLPLPDIDPSSIKEE